MRCLLVPWPALNYEYKTLIRLYNLANLVSRTGRGTNKLIEIAIQAELARNLKVTAFNPAPTTGDKREHDRARLS